MNQKLITLAVIVFSITSIKCLAQDLDSIHVYALSMKSMYRIRIDRDLIKNEVEPIVLAEKGKMQAIHETLIKRVKGRMRNNLKSNQLDIRLFFEFFENGKVVNTIGVTPYNTMFVNYTLYSCDKQKLKYLDEYVSGLSRILGIR